MCTQRAPVSSKESKYMLTLYAQPLRSRMAAHSRDDMYPPSMSHSRAATRLSGSTAPKSERRL